MRIAATGPRAPRGEEPECKGTHAGVYLGGHGYVERADEQLRLAWEIFEGEVPTSP